MTKNKDKTAALSTKTLSRDTPAPSPQLKEVPPSAHSIVLEISKLDLFLHKELLHIQTQTQRVENAFIIEARRVIQHSCKGNPEEENSLSEIYIKHLADIDQHQVKILEQFNPEKYTRDEIKEKLSEIIKSFKQKRSELLNILRTTPEILNKLNYKDEDSKISIKHSTTKKSYADGTDTSSLTEDSYIEESDTDGTDTSTLTEDSDIEESDAWEYEPAFLAPERIIAPLARRPVINLNFLSEDPDVLSALAMQGVYLDYEGSDV